MKISNSKKQLAKSIHENGGWRDGAGFAAQDQNATVTFFVDAPWRCGVLWEASEYEAISCIALTGFAHTNWHQTILSREEYFHLYPAPDADGWVEWNGGECPVGEDVLVVLKMRGGDLWKDGEPSMAGRMGWGHDGDDSDIIAYRLCKTEKPKSTAVGDDETNLAAKEELEAMKFVESPEQRTKLAKIYAPSIEQLAADYRAKLAIAQQAQEEADSHRCGAEDALENLVAAGKELGLVLSVEAPEPVGPTKPYTGKFYHDGAGKRNFQALCDGCGKRYGLHYGDRCESGDANA